MRRKCLLIALALLAVSFALAQPAFDATARVEEARQKAAAVRAARVDAIRQLGEAVIGVRIDSKTVVRDFVTESDEINAQFMAFLQGAHQEGKPNLYEDGTVEVTMVIYLDEIISGLEDIHQNNGSRRISSPEQFQNMRKTGQREFRATGTGAMAISPLPPSSIDVWTYVAPQGKAMARRAAEADAYRNIGETMMGVRINSTTTVKDFVTVSDQINASFQGIVYGAEFIEYTYRREGLVEVTAQVDVSKLISMLSGISRQQYKGKNFPPQAFEGIRNYVCGDVIHTTGVGAPPAKYIRKTPMYESPVTAEEPFNRIDEPYQPSRPPQFQRFVPDWADKTIKVTGTGAYRQDMPVGQARASAERAAQLDGYRLLVEQAMGLHLKAQTTVQDFVTTNDEIVGKVNAYLRGATVVATRDLGPAEGIVEVDMQLYLGDMWEIIDAEYQKHLKAEFDAQYK